MHKSIYLIVMIMTMTVSFAQTDTLNAGEKRWDASVDFFSRYVWRGQCWGGNYITMQPAFNYKLSKKWTAGAWATTNFQKNYFYSDNITGGKGYQEIDLGLSYQANSFLTLQVFDFYWPAFQSLEGVDRSYFNYGPDSVKTVEAAVLFDFSDGYNYPFNATISTFIAGNDYRYDADGEHPKQNFTTYIEAGYTFSNVFDRISHKTFQKIDVSPVIGAVLNNQAQYYPAADYQGVSFVNLSLNAIRTFDLGKGFSMPVSLNYTHNAAKENTETYGRDFLVAGISFVYE